MIGFKLKLLFENILIGRIFTFYYFLFRRNMRELQYLLMSVVYVLFIHM